MQGYISAQMEKALGLPVGARRCRDSPAVVCLHLCPRLDYHPVLSLGLTEPGQKMWVTSSKRRAPPPSHLLEICSCQPPLCLDIPSSPAPALSPWALNCPISSYSICDISPQQVGGIWIRMARPILNWLAEPCGTCYKEGNLSSDSYPREMAQIAVLPREALPVGPTCIQRRLNAQRSAGRLIVSSAQGDNKSSRKHDSCLQEKPSIKLQQQQMYWGNI